MAAQNNIQITDYSNEKSSFGFTSVTVNAGNYTAQSGAAVAVSDAVANLSIGVVSKQQLGELLIDAPGIATNPYAQREMKWLVQYQAATSGKIFTVEIAAPDVTDNVVANTDVADLGSTDWIAMLSAWAAFVKSPDNGTEATAIIGAKLVGRNL
jgi:hypothetical protein